MKKLLLFLLLVISFSFADATATVQPPSGVGATLAPTSPAWLPIAVLAGITSVILLALLYMVAQGFDLQDLKFLAKEEFYQVIVTFFIIAILQGTVMFVDSLSTNFYGQNMHQTTFDKLNGEITFQEKIFDNLQVFSVQAGSEASKSFFCSLQGTGYSISSCSSFRPLLIPVSTAFQAISLTITELSSMRTLVSFGQKYAFTLLLPAGLLLRTLKFTRGAGGLLIGFAVALYIFLPLGYLFMDDLMLSSKNPYKTNPLPILPSNFDCDPTNSAISDSSTLGGWIQSGSFDSINDASVTQFINLGTSNLVKSKSLYVLLSKDVESYLYAFLIRGTLATVISVLILIAGMRMVSKLAGAEVDVSILSRIG
ncbi:MAG: hypothetical protein Q7S22_06600 [Candidatus Micrarchaeota archaeon]|nr:hypothetical protein [Candidatus Micrarchaeota archaeon]